jgi:hypothetical protein
MILPHHLFDPFCAFGEAEDGRDSFLQFECQVILFSSAQEMELVPHSPKEFEAFFEASRVIREEDRVPTIGFVFCPDDPPADLKVPQPSFSSFDIGF